MTPPRRSTDPEWESYDRNGFSWKLPLNLGTLEGKGWTSIVALILVGAFLMAGCVVYVVWAGFQAFQADHKELLRANGRLACVISMNETERKAYREGHLRDLPCFWIAQ